VAKRLSAATLIHETKAVSNSATLALAVRVRSPLLLKTILPTIHCAYDGATFRTSITSVQDSGNAIHRMARNHVHGLTFARFSGLDEGRPVVTLKALRTAEGSQHCHWENPFFREIATPGVEHLTAATPGTIMFGEHAGSSKLASARGEKTIYQLHHNKIVTS